MVLSEYLIDLTEKFCQGYGESEKDESTYGKDIVDKVLSGSLGGSVISGSGWRRPPTKTQLVKVEVSRRDQRLIPTRTGIRAQALEYRNWLSPNY